MKIIAFSDIHGKINLIKRFSAEIENADLVLLAGDVTHFGAQEDARCVIDKIRQHCDCILAVPGNCDYPVVGHYFEYENMNLHGQLMKYSTLFFSGLGGSLPCPGVTPNELTEDEIEKLLFSITQKVVAGTPLIFVSHQPPFHTKNDRVRRDVHVGSVAVRHFIEKIQPLICFTGHIHEGIGIDQIGLTKIVNPGPFFTGAYVKAEINSHIKSLEIKNINNII